MAPIAGIEWRFANQTVHPRFGTQPAESVRSFKSYRGALDSRDIAVGNDTDAYGNGVPDGCEQDCNSNGMSDFNELQADLTLEWALAERRRSVVALGLSGFESEPGGGRSAR